MAAITAFLAAFIGQVVVIAHRPQIPTDAADTVPLQLLEESVLSSRVSFLVV
jgi:hypothetical protein